MTDPIPIMVFLPPDVKEWETDLTDFFDLMVRKLHYHKNKGHWKDADPGKSLQHAKDEVNEASFALLAGDREKFRDECADIANMALIAATAGGKNET